MIVRIFDADPTRTLYLRSKFEKALAAKFAFIKKSIKETMALKVFTRDDAANPSRFAFKTNPQKVDEFMSWLYSLEKEQGLRITKRATGISASTNPVWADIYIDTAYKQGIRRARQEITKQGIKSDASQTAIELAFASPIHAERVGMIYTRVYSDLQGITDEMDKQISRVLAEGLINGEGIEQITRNMVDRVDKIGVTRARLLARTEVVSAHHKANIAEYKAFGIKGVKVLAEVLVSGNNTCDECYAEQEKGPRPIEEVENLIPLHPGCACVCIGVVD